MALTPALLINDARDRHPLFTRQRHPDPILLRALTSEERRMVGKALAANPSSITATLEIALDSYSFDTGQALPAFHRVESAHAGDPPIPMFRVAWPNHLYAGGLLAYSVHGNTLFLAGAAEHWSGIEVVNVSYAPVPVDLAALSDPMVLPDTAESYLVSFLAHFMARRLSAKEITPEEMAQFVAERGRCESDFLAEIRATSVEER
jgi:hypothetical protein